jgi:ADP-ribosylglycohydrolase/protein-tyrosine phosphatase
VDLALRIEGAVFGHLVGDALGVPYEFRLPEAIGGPGAVAWGVTGSHGQPPGTWSDDGALMLALLDSLLESGFDPDDQGRRFLDWWRRGAYAPGGVVFDIGGTTSTALRAIEDGTPAELAGGSGVMSQANGSLMRILPLALWGHGRLDRPDLAILAAAASRVTHASPTCQATCAAYVLLVDGLLRGTEPASALEASLADAEATFERLAAPGDSLGDLARLEGLDALRAWRDDHRPAGRGGVLDCFWSAWTAFAAAEDYSDAVRRAVALGHDTDTTAAVAGGLAGAWFGLDSIPAEWLAGLRDRALPGLLVDRLLAAFGWRTSTVSPLRVAWVPLDEAGTLAAAVSSGGALGMTFLIGKRHHGWTGDWWRSLELDADALRDVHGATTYVQLVEDHELELTRTTGLGAALAARGIELVRHPVVDMSVPADRLAYRALLDDLRARVLRGERVVVACRGGLGRTGTAVACLLVDAGLAPTEAIALTRRARPGAIERGSQLDWVEAWGADARH